MEDGTLTRTTNGVDLMSFANLGNLPLQTLAHFKQITDLPGDVNNLQKN
jgi:hypothetical protein